MKKVLRIVLIIVLMMSMLVGLTACNDEDDEEESSSRSSKSSRQEREEEILDTARDVYEEARETIKQDTSKLDEIEAGIIAKEGALAKAEDAAEKTRISTAKESLQMAISSLSTNFMTEWMNDQTLTIGGYVLQSNLQQELKDYQIKSYNKNTGEGVMEDDDGYQYSFTLQEKNAYLMDITEFEAMD